MAPGRVESRIDPCTCKTRTRHVTPRCHNHAHSLFCAPNLFETPIVLNVPIDSLNSAIMPKVPSQSSLKSLTQSQSKQAKQPRPKSTSLKTKSLSSDVLGSSSSQAKTKRFDPLSVVRGLLLTETEAHSTKFKEVIDVDALPEPSAPKPTRKPVSAQTRSKATPKEADVKGKGKERGALR